MGKAWWLAYGKEGGQTVGQASSRVRRGRVDSPPQRRSGPRRGRPPRQPRLAKAPAAGDRTEGSSSPIVGIGASAGGLEAFTELLSHLPDDTGMAFVLIQHLDPKHESHLTELLSKASKMPVSEVKGETRAEANHVYVIPPRCNLGISDGVLHTPPRPDSGRNMPIDSFLRALAADRGSQGARRRSVGNRIGWHAGPPGDQGRGRHHLRSGDANRRSSMACREAPSPRVSRILCCRRPESRGNWWPSRALFVSPSEPRKAAEQPGDAELKKIFRLLRSATGVDFTYYKHSTLQRRIKRRMALRGFEKLEDYSRDLEQNRDEANALCESFFITVTAFFREPAVFEDLKKKVFPALVENRGREDPIRIWVPGCSTGEEAYSIAICLMEFLDEAEVSLPFEIFATDISETAIEKARAGTYTEAALAHVSPQRLARFFTRTERGYQVAKIIRDVCVFARHDVTQDPPFSKLDLISCCNVLIYLGAVLQRKVLSILHYALKPTGFLVLGPSESIGTLSESFQQVEKTHTIYRVLPAAGKPAPPISEDRRAESGVDLRERIAEGRAGPDVQREADRLVLAEHAPPGAIVDDDMNIVQVRGHTAPYLELSPGEPTHNLLKMAREGLIAGLGKAFRDRQTNERHSQRRRLTDRRQWPVNRGHNHGHPVPGLVLFQETLFPGPVRGRRAERRPGGEAQALDTRQAGERPVAARACSNQRVSAIDRRRQGDHRWKSLGQRTKRRRRATRNWKPRRKSWNRPMKN